MVFNLRPYLKFLLWFLFFVTFTSELLKIVFEFSPTIGHQQLNWANAFFWSSLFLMEIIMAGMIFYYVMRHSARRKRLITLFVCHFSVILLFPMFLNDWSWTCLLYPWPHSFQAFDPATPNTAFAVSLFVGFILAPFVTYVWGAKGFCGYLCPHGALFSETQSFNWRPFLLPPYLPEGLFYKDPDGKCFLRNDSRHHRSYR